MPLHLVWLEFKQDAIASQLVTIGHNLGNLGTQYGLTTSDAPTWQNEAAQNSYLQTVLIPSARLFGRAHGGARRTANR